MYNATYTVVIWQRYLGLTPEDEQLFEIHVSLSAELRDDSEGETRSHGLYYRPDDGASDAGIFGLPVAGAGRAGYELVEGELRDGGIIIVEKRRISFAPRDRS